MGDIFMSKLCYIITLWGGCDGYLMSALQIVQNKVMRSVCRKGKRYPVKLMLKEMNWMSVRQVAFFQSVMQVRKVLNTKQPAYLYDRLVGGNRLRYARRLVPGEELRVGGKPRLHLIESSWRWRADQQWAQLPRELKTVNKVPAFRAKLSAWVKENIEI